MAQIQVSIVTPETTTFDEAVDSVIVPLYDGEKGILPGHSAMLGRLGPGELRAISGSNQRCFYVDGGFVQIANDTISVLTGKSIAAEKIDVASARTALEKAQAQEDNPNVRELRRKAIAQASAQIRIGEKSQR